MKVSASTIIAFFLASGTSNAFILTNPSVTSTTSITSSTSISAIYHSDVPYSSSVSSDTNPTTTFLTQQLKQQQPKSSSSLSKLSTIQSKLNEGITNYLLIPPASAATTSDTTPPPSPPTKNEIKLLRDAFSALYGERNPEKAEGLLSDAIVAWERQNPDEKAALFRVRGDCYTVSYRSLWLQSACAG